MVYESESWGWRESPAGPPPPGARMALLPESGPRAGVLLAPVAAERGGRAGR